GRFNATVAADKAGAGSGGEQAWPEHYPYRDDGCSDCGEYQCFFRNGGHAKASRSVRGFGGCIDEYGAAATEGVIKAKLARNTLAPGLDDLLSDIEQIALCIQYDQIRHRAVVVAHL